MQVFKHKEFAGHEQVVFCNDDQTGLRAIVAIHDTTLGPALGGCRMWDYPSEEEALADVLRLSRGMTYKAAVTGLSLGGGKAVIFGDPARTKSPALFHAFGRFVESLGGRYITAEDVNISVADMELVREETRYVSGLGTGSGDPSPLTALGVYSGIRAAVQHRLKQDSLQGLTIAVQGCGKVGSHLCRLLHEDGAALVIADMDAARAGAMATETGARVVDSAGIHREAVDVFAPCALGGGLNDTTIPEIRAGIIAGAANNQLLNEAIHAAQLVERGILYAPDYVINAGGLINVYLELRGYNLRLAEEKARQIARSLEAIFQVAEKDGITTVAASNRIAEDRLQQARKPSTHLKNSMDAQDWLDDEHRKKSG